MHLQNIELLNFKNYDELNLHFSPEINCLVGENGSGKTNLLDAIHYLSLTKSAFNTIDTQNILHEADFMVIRGTFSKEDREETVQCSLQQGQRKIIKRNKKAYERNSEHIGLFPVVLIAPNDTDVIREGSETRRKFFDSVISQVDQEYLHNLIQYNHVLKQRNSLLKHFSERNKVDYDLLEPYTLQIGSIGQKVFERRRSFLAEYTSIFQEHYKNLSEDKEQVEIIYESTLDVANPLQELNNSISKDVATHRTNIGIHKDDFVFLIGGYPVKKYGSQGQQKSFLIALKLSQFDIMKLHKGFKPILLLDDIFDKLDDRRIAKLMELVSGHAFGQLFVTDARPERTERIFKQLKDVNIKIFKLDAGAVEESFQL